jgi:hypothetical protein
LGPHHRSTAVLVMQAGKLPGTHSIVGNRKSFAIPISEGKSVMPWFRVDKPFSFTCYSLWHTVGAIELIIQMSSILWRNCCCALVSICNWRAFDVKSALIHNPSGFSLFSALTQHLANNLFNIGSAHNSAFEVFKASL